MTKHDAAQDRQRRILELARSEGRVEVSELSESLDVAPETVRRDLTLLESHGLVRREYGAAYPVEGANFESDLARREAQFGEDKVRIAVESARHLEDAETVYIDEGYTPLLIARELPVDRRLTIITASLPAATQLASRPTYTVIMVGGRVRGLTMATVDHWATQMLDGFVIDLAFLGANGVTPETGLTTPDPAVATVKSHVVKIARRKVLSGIRGKFGSPSFCKFADVADIDLIVTDTRLTASDARRYSALGPPVIRV
ncbi:MAG: DeoR/GlpR family DNA-binding transcription regulator [Jatrophihabitans sp.]